MLVMEKYKLNLEDALDFVKRVHKETNPTNDQLLCVKNFIEKN